MAQTWIYSIHDCTGNWRSSSKGLEGASLRLQKAVSLDDVPMDRQFATVYSQICSFNKTTSEVWKPSLAPTLARFIGLFCNVPCFNLNMLYYRFLLTTQTWGFPIPPLLGRLGHTPGSGLPADTKRTHFRPHQVHMYSIRLLSAIPAS